MNLEEIGRTVDSRKRDLGFSSSTRIENEPKRSTLHRDQQRDKHLLRLEEEFVGDFKGETLESRAIQNKFEALADDINAATPHLKTMSLGELKDLKKRITLLNRGIRTIPFENFGKSALPGDEPDRIFKILALEGATKAGVRYNRYEATHRFDNAYALIERQIEALEPAPQTASAAAQIAPKRGEPEIIDLT